MFVFFTSFSAVYPIGNTIEIKDWTFQDLDGNAYTVDKGAMDAPGLGKMAWTRSVGIDAPYYFPASTDDINVIVTELGAGEVSV